VEYERPFRSRRQTAPMGQYRLYYLDSVDRMISRSFEFEADSDEAAVRLAESFREGRPVELWRGTSKLKTWPKPGA